MKNKTRLIHLNFSEDATAPFPSYFNANLLSCSYNTDFEWLIFTNRHNIPPLPPNVKVVKMPLEGFGELVKEKLGINSFRLKKSMDDFSRDYSSRSYVKTCDFRHAFGLIFEDYLTGYDFWGHCDIDVIYGDLNKYITDEILDASEMVRPPNPPGHFSLFKNTTAVNMAFENVPLHRISGIKGREVAKLAPYKETLEKNHYDEIEKGLNEVKTYYDIMSSSHYFAADERASHNLGLRLHYIGNLRISNGTDIQAARHALYGEFALGKKLDIPAYNRSRSPFEWKLGRLFANDGSEAGIIHMRKKLKVSCDEPVDSFFILHCS